MITLKRGNVTIDRGSVDDFRLTKGKLQKRQEHTQHDNINFTPRCLVVAFFYLEEKKVVSGK